MMDKQFIYRIINKANGFCYVGRTNNPTRRKNNHFTYLKAGKHPNKKLQTAYNEYGKSKFKFEVIDELDTSTNVYATEMNYIRQFNSVERGYNNSEGGNGSRSINGKPIYRRSRREKTDSSELLLALRGRIAELEHALTAKELEVLTYQGREKAMHYLLNEAYKDRETIAYEMGLMQAKMEEYTIPNNTA